MVFVAGEAAFVSRCNYYQKFRTNKITYLKVLKQSADSVYTVKYWDSTVQ